MLWYRRTFLGVMTLTATLASASADVIRPSGEVGRAISLVAPPEVSRSGPNAAVPSRLALSSELVDGCWSNLALRPLLSEDQSSPSLSGPAMPEAAPLVLVRPNLPKDRLLGGSSDRLTVAKRAETGSGESTNNIRIPEPASVALVAAGVIGLIARSRLRRDLHPKKAEPIAVDLV